MSLDQFILFIIVLLYAIFNLGSDVAESDDVQISPMQPKLQLQIKGPNIPGVSIFENQFSKELNK